jgi:cysteine desulfurase/selenocysteine lyase
VTYLDHAATSFPKAPGVSSAVASFLDNSAGNPGRGGHRLTVGASRVIETARDDTADLLGGAPERLLFGPGATFWMNTVLRGRLQRGDRVVTSSLEHNAVMRPLTDLAEHLDLSIHSVPGATATGVPTAGEIASAVAEAPTALVVLTHASNVSGAVLPVEAIARTIAPVPVVVDGAQAAGSLRFDFASSGAAAWIGSGHKGLLGPPGVGVLLLAPGFEVEPLITGGTGSRSESFEMPPLLPDRLEAGTPNGAGIAGLGAAVRWLRERSIDALEDHGRNLARRLARDLGDIPGCRVIGFDPEARHTSTVSFVIDPGDVAELGAWLDREAGFAVRIGLHCAPMAHRRLETFPNGTVRVAPGPFVTTEQIDRFLGAVATWRRRFDGGVIRRPKPSPEGLSDAKSP